MNERFFPGAAWALFLPLLLTPASAWGQEAVMVAAEEGRGRIRRTGEILEFDRRVVRLRTGTGQTVELPAAQVLDFHYVRSSAQQEADSLREGGDAAGAAAAYARAAREEPRRWVRHELAAARIGELLKQAASRRGEDRAVVEAGELFASLLREHEETRRFDCIPLNWVTHRPSPALENAARAWLAEEIPAVQLMGVSWLPGAGGGGADVLARLQTAGDPRVAALARAQGWRLRPAAGREEVDRWRASLEEIPSELRGGPSYVVGRALLRHGDLEGGALLLLRPPLLDSGGPALAAEALLAAGEALEKLARPRQAATLYDELLRTHGDTLPAELARERLAKLAEK